MTDSTELGTNISPVKGKEEHMAQPRKGYDSKPDFSGKDMKNQPEFISQPLVIGQKSGDKW
jgi:hypothetical protein